MAPTALNQTRRLDSLFGIYRSQQLELDDRNRAYADTRDRLMNTMVKHGFKTDEVETMMESYERMWTPLFGAAGSRLPGNDTARRLHDAAMRSGVRPEDWQAFVASVSDYRLAENRSNEISAQLFMEGGSARFGMARGEVETLLGMKSEIVRAARRMNPGLDIKAVNQLVEDEAASGPGRFDPLRRTVSLALDPTSGNARREAYASLWQSVSGLLNEKERELLARRFATNASSVPNGWAVANEKAAEAFAKYMSPGRDKKDRFALFQKAERFLGRVANAARGYGFQVPEDVWNRAAIGKLAARQSDTALRVPSAGFDQAGYAAARNSVKGLSEFELHMAKRRQIEALDAHRRKISTLSRKMIAHNPAIRGFKSIATYLTSTSEDTFRKDQYEMRALSRGLAAIEAELSARRRGMAAEPGLQAAPNAPLPVSPVPGGQGPNGQGPSGPGPAPGGRDGERTDNVVSWPHTGRHGTYVAKDAMGNGPKGYDMEIRYVAPDGFDRTLAFARSEEAAMACVDAFERVAGQGRAGQDAQALAETANQAGTGGNLDIHSLKSSRLIDPELDRRINEADVHALVYPLKTGDLVFCGNDGRWRAATVEEFRAYAETMGSEHEKAAAKVVSLDAHREANRGETNRGETNRGEAGKGTAFSPMEDRLRSGEDGAAMPAGPAVGDDAKPPRPASDAERVLAAIAQSVTNQSASSASIQAPPGAQEGGRPPGPDAPSLASPGLSVAARIDPAARRPELDGYQADATRALKLDPATSGADAKALVGQLDNGDLLKRHADTMAGISTSRSMSLQMQMDTARTALEAELKSRGLFQAPLDPTPGPARPKDRGSQGDRGPDRD